MSSLTVTNWISDFRAGNLIAARRLWDRAENRLTAVTNRFMSDHPQHDFDEEDVVASAFGSFYEAFHRGAFRDIDNKNALWQLFLTITLNKAREKTRRARRLKRGSQYEHVPVADQHRDYLAAEPIPAEVMAAAVEECDCLLRKLGRDEIRMVAVLKVEGHTDEEIAAQLNCTRRSVQRRLNLIRRIWSEEMSPA